MNIFKSLFRSRDKPKNYYNSSSPFLFGGTTAGKVANERTALSVTTVYACILVLSEALAGLPLHVYLYNRDGSKVAFCQGGNPKKFIFGILHKLFGSNKKLTILATPVLHKA